VDEVKRLRLEKGWSQNELAYHAKLAPSVISLIETGKRDPNATTLRKLAEALEVRIPDLFEESGSGKGRPRSSPEPSLFNGLEEERHAGVISGVISWAAYTRQIASRVRGHADDPDSPAFRDPWSALFFVEEANRNATDLNRFVDEQLTAALEIADLEAMHELMAAFEELDRAIDTASARARLMEAGRSHSEIGEARRRAEEAATERENAASELSGLLGHSA
jgi:transcriptional regulator with XRE-family HTH domain